MVERTVTIKLGLDDGIGNRLQEIKQQRDALLAKSKIALNIDAGGIEQARRAAVQAQAANAAAMRDMTALGGAITSKAIAPLAQYQQMLGSVIQAGRTIGPGLVSALGRVSVEFQRQRDLASFWGTSGYMHGGVAALKSSMSSFLATGGAGFTGWLQNASSHLAQYRTELTVAAAAMVGMAAAAGLSAKHTQNYISSTMDSRLMARKLTDKAGAEKWVQGAQGTDWSAGRESRMGVFQTVLSKNKSMGQKAAQKATEDIEKYFFVNQEMLQNKGIASAEQLASEISAPQLTGDSAAKFEDIFGLGFSQISAPARLARLGGEAPDDKELANAVNARPDEVLSKRLTATTQAMGDAIIPVLNTVLGAFLKISDAIGKIPDLGKAMGWGAVLLGAASAGLIFVSMIGSLIPGLQIAYTMLGKMGIATKLAAAGQWLLNAAMTANPLGIAIVAIAGLIAVLYALEKEFGLVTKAWNAFSNSSIGKGIFAYIESGKKAIGEMLGSLGKAYSSGGLKGEMHIALDALAANSPGLKVLLIIADFIRKVWTNSAVLNKLVSAGSQLLQRMVDFFTWLLDAINSGVQWIKDGLGITKAEKEANVKTIAEKEGVYQTKSGKWGKVLESAGGAGTKTPEEDSQLFQSATPSSRLQRAIDEANNAPNSVFAKIGEVISGAMSNIKTIFDPVLSPLTKAIKDLLDFLNIGEDESPAPDIITNPATGEGIQGSTKTVRGTSSGSGDLTTPRQFVSPETPATPAGFTSPETPATPTGFTPAMAAGDLTTPRQFVSPETPATPAGFTSPETPATPTGFTPAMAAGGSIIGSGSIIGHSGEEVDPAKVVAGGKTTLQQINDLFSGGASMGGEQSLSINTPVNVNVQIDKVSSDVDIDNLISRIGNEGADKLIFALRSKLESTSLRGIGYLRG